MEVYTTTVDRSYSLTVAVGASFLGVVGVLIPWGGRFVLPFLLLLLLLLLLLVLLTFVCVCVCVLVCVLTTADLIIDLCNCCLCNCFFCVIAKILNRKKKLLKKKNFRSVIHYFLSKSLKHIKRYTNADLKICLYVCVYIKIIPWKVGILKTYSTCFIYS